MMNRKVFTVLIGLLLCCGTALAQDSTKSELQQHAEAEQAKGHVASARFHYIRAYESYARKGQMQQSVECGTQATQLYYKENFYKEAFDLLRDIDHTIEAAQALSAGQKAALHYQTTKERMLMYMKMHRGANVLDQLNTMDTQVRNSGDEALANDLLYNRAIYYYTFGQTQQGNAVFKEMAQKMTASGDYGKVEKVYQTLIANGRRSGSSSLVAQAYSNYIAWKDSVAQLKRTTEIEALKKQIAQGESAIAERDASLSSRRATIAGLGVLLAILVAALALAVVVLLRFIVLTRKQKRTIRLANENNALKAQFISNISAQLEPTLKRLDTQRPEVKSMLDFTQHIQTLAALESTEEGDISSEDINLPQFCGELMDQIRDKVKPGVTLKVDAPKMTAPLCREYVSHILLHLLHNAAEYTPEGGHIWLEYKKRGPHSHQFLVSDTGQGIPAEQRDEVFKPFRDIHDLTKGDGLGLPICRQMALKMKGDLAIASDYTRGTRFVLSLNNA